MAIERLSDDELDDVSGGLIVQQGTIFYVYDDVDGELVGYGINTHDRGSANMVAHRYHVGDEVISKDQYTERFGRPPRLKP